MTYPPLNKLYDSQCTRCELHKNATHVCIPSSGATNKFHCLVVGEAPGRNEDEQNAPFVGRSGWLLDRELNRALAVDNARVLIPVTNAVKCRPSGPDGTYNQTPQYPDINTCVDAYLTHEIFRLDARVILALGNAAAQALLDVTGVSMLRESWHSLGTKIERWVLVTYHPAYVLRRGLDSEVAVQFREDIKEFTIKAMEAS
jgi:uracil-DNA glycosylase family 4